MVKGLIMLGLAAFMWFGIAKAPEEKSVRGSMIIIKKLFGQKGYIKIAKFLAIFMLIGSIQFFIEYFTGFSMKDIL